MKCSYCGEQVTECSICGEEFEEGTEIGCDGLEHYHAFPVVDCPINLAKVIE